jgi:hypothetical protein
LDARRQDLSLRSAGIWATSHYDFKSSLMAQAKAGDIGH